MSQYRLLKKIEGPEDLKRLPVERLPEVAAEMRQAICEQVSRSGGHLAPNLGVVELTLALHYVFDFSYDRLLFDVGHQCYPHKLLTGRFGMLSRLRKRDGIAGFPEPRESSFDLFSVGHAGSGISTAVGMARGDALNGEAGRRVVTLVGDSSVVNGLALEGLNNAGTLRRQFLVVLNDNGMSIGAPQGALAGSFEEIRLDAAQDRPEESAPVSSHAFEKFGLHCAGPFDGHDLPQLIETLEQAGRVDQPLLLHVKTVKGQGFDFSCSDPTTFHSPKPFRVEGCRAELLSGGRSFTSAYADAMIDLMSEDPKVVAVTAGMPDGTGVAKVAPLFPQRTFDVGIAESHATDMCAGMAKTGLRPFAAIYSTFLQRGFDQVFQEVALQGLPVRFCMDRAGLVGGDGAVHHGFLDVAYLRGFPGMALTAAIDEPTLRAALAFMRDYEEGPSAVRYPRDDVPAPVQGEATPPFELGRANLLAPGSDLAILAYGFPAIHALAARETLAREGYRVAVYDARFAKPVDLELIAELVDGGNSVLTVEDHLRTGGFGSAVIETCNEHGLATERIHRLGLPDRWIYQGARSEQLAEAGIDAEGIAKAARGLLGATPARQGLERGAAPARSWARPAAFRG